MHSTQQMIPLPIATEDHHVVRTVAPPIIHAHVQPYFEDQYKIYHAHEYSNEDDERYDDIKGIKENYHVLEKRLRFMEGDKVFGAPARDMCLVYDLVIPTNFKTYDFDKYEGHSCPKSHLIM